MTSRRRGWECVAAGLLFAAVATAINGLVWGVGDHGIVAAFHGERLVGDLLEAGRDRHPSLLWAVLGALPAAWGWHAVHGASLAVTGAALLAIGRRITPVGARPWLALAVLAPAHIALGGAPTLDPLLLPRGVALPLELLAVLLALDRRWAGAWALAGLALAVHAPSGVPVVAGLAMAWWPGRRALWPPLVALFGALPAVWMADVRSRLEPMDPEWWALVQARLAHHADPASWGAVVWLTAAAWLAVAVWGLRGTALTRIGAGMLAWMVLGGALAAAHIPLFVNLEPWQVGRFVVIGGALALARRGHWLLVLIAALTFTVTAERPRWLPEGPTGDVAALARWAQGTEPGALFVIPPDLESFRPLARRPNTGTAKDGGELQFDRQLALRWRDRMTALCGCDPIDPLTSERTPGARRRGLSARVARGYAALSAEAVVDIARSVDAQWIVREVGAIPPRLDGQQAVARFGALAVYPVATAD